jgi:hypothetical protein
MSIDIQFKIEAGDLTTRDRRISIGEYKGHTFSSIDEILIDKIEAASRIEGYSGANCVKSRDGSEIDSELIGRETLDSERVIGPKATGCIIGKIRINNSERFKVHCLGRETWTVENVASLNSTITISGTDVNSRIENDVPDTIVEGNRIEDYIFQRWQFLNCERFGMNRANRRSDKAKQKNDAHYSFRLFVSGGVYRDLWGVVKISGL